MASAFVFPINRPVDSNGLTMSGAKAYFYATDTTTPVSVYTTSALDIAHANPVVADAGGLFPDIFLDPSRDYRMILKNAAGVTQDDVDPITSDGASAFVTPQQFGAVGDDVTNDGPAFVAALAYLHARVTTGYGYGKGSAILRIPRGTYYLGTTTLDINHSLIIEGESAGGYAQAGGSVLRWAASTSGIRLQRPDTTGTTGIGGVDYGASGTIIRNLTLKGAFSGTEGEYHGIQLRCMGAIRDVLIDGFAGDGIYTKTKLSAPNTGYVGSSSGSVIENTTVQNCRNGIYIEEVDSNALLISNPLLSTNRRYGLWSKTTLGSTVIAGVIATNGMTAGFPTICSYSGNWYYCLPNQEVGAKANAPSGTTANNTYWGYFRAGVVTAVTPAWVVNATDWRAGGTMRLESSFEQYVLLGVYMEPDEAPVQIAATCQALVFAPMLGNPVMFDGSLYGGGLSGTGTGIATAKALTVNGDFTATKSPQAIAMDATSVRFSGFVKTVADTGGLLEIGRPANAVNARIRPDSTAPGLALLSPDNTERLVIANASASLNIPLATSAALTSSSATGGIGYATGAGGAVTQLTSRTTGVQLDKVCGGITLFSAAGSATYATFTVTNSTVAATDTIRVVQKSGTDLYNILVTNVAAGSFKISFATTGGTTVEQPVFNFSVHKAVAA